MKTFISKNLLKTSLRDRSGTARDKILDMSPDNNSNQAADSKKPNDNELEEEPEGQVRS